MGYRPRWEATHLTPPVQVVQDDRAVAATRSERPPVGVEIDGVAVHAVGDVEQFRGSPRVPDDEDDFSALLVLHGEVTAVAAESNHDDTQAIAGQSDLIAACVGASDEHVAPRACRGPCVR